MIFRTFIEKQSVFESVMKNLMVLTIPIFGLIYSLNHHELWKWFLLYLPIGILGFYLVGDNGVLLDLDNKRFKVFKNLFFWDIGNWENLPSIDKVVLKCTNDFIDTTDSRSRYWTNTGYRIMTYRIALLNSNNDFKLVVLITKDEKEGFYFGESIAKNLNLQLKVLKN